MPNVSRDRTKRLSSWKSPTQVWITIAVVKQQRMQPPASIEYWIVNLRDLQVEVYREPDGTEYRSRRIYKAGEAIQPLAAQHASISVTDLLGRA